MHRNTQQTTAPRQAQEIPLQEQQPAGCLLRVYWVFFGNALVALLALAILQGGARLGLADVFYWLGVASLAGCRYADIRHYGGSTAEGQPATIAHWRRYSLLLLGVAIVVWLGVHALGFLSG